MAVSGASPARLIDHFSVAHKGSEATAQALLIGGALTVDGGLYHRAAMKRMKCATSASVGSWPVKERR